MRSQLKTIYNKESIGLIKASSEPFLTLTSNTFYNYSI